MEDICKNLGLYFFLYIQAGFTKLQVLTTRHSLCVEVWASWLLCLSLLCLVCIEIKDNITSPAGEEAKIRTQTKTVGMKGVWKLKVKCLT